MRSTLACSVIALSLFTAPAMADERPFNWSGFYIGGHGGWAQSAIDPAGPDYPAGAPTQNVKGGFVGGQVGAQYQWGWLVAGVEADISFANLEATVRDGNYLTQTGSINQFGTVRGRLGFAMGPFMPYVTGGWAWDRMSQNQVCPDPAAVPFGHCKAANGFAPYDLTKTETSTGWVYGGGFEYAVAQNWTIRLEAMRLEFDAATFNLGKMANGVENGTKTFEHKIDVVRFGGNLKF